MQAQEPVLEGRLALVQLTGDEIEAGIVLAGALGGGYRHEDLAASQVDVAGEEVR